jgi:hypothetical protein
MINYKQMLQLSYPINAVFYGEKGVFPPKLYRVPIVCLTSVEDEEEDSYFISCMIITKTGFVTPAEFEDNFIGIEQAGEMDWDSEVQDFLAKQAKNGD